MTKKEKLIDYLKGNQKVKGVYLEENGDSYLTVKRKGYEWKSREEILGNPGAEKQKTGK